MNCRRSHYPRTPRGRTPGQDPTWQLRAPWNVMQASWMASLCSMVPSAPCQVSRIPSSSQRTCFRHSRRATCHWEEFLQGSEYCLILPVSSDLTCLVSSYLPRLILPASSHLTCLVPSYLSHLIWVFQFLSLDIIYKVWVSEWVSEWFNAVSATDFILHNWTYRRFECMTLVKACVIGRMMFNVDLTFHIWQPFSWSGSIWLGGTKGNSHGQVGGFINR